MPRKSCNLATCQVLDLPFSTRECSVQLPSDIAVGSVIYGGYVASVMTKYIDLRNSHIRFYRPIFASAPLMMTLREVNIGKGQSTLRVESFQNEKLVASADIAITKLSITGITFQTDWRLSTPPPVDLTKFETDSDPNWISYHCAFIPKDSEEASSRPSGSGGKARWTNDMIQFVRDMALPIQENYVPHGEGKPLPMGSIAAMLEFAKRQEKARNEGQSDWRVLNDGARKFWGKILNVSLTLSTEIRQRLPAEGVRWLYLRTECKGILNDQMDMGVLNFEISMKGWI
ncbi:hypothetical protein BO83DRAFT_411398 [Aspergillus eucalypticola CBS 122712]|uniref:Acyl-CoA thioesterase-like N-terminal HotDog domain-containing protein n=1 Tax=Aspergillus eucalypticola (strain CBS 122712 / IBT 29274) TaxID=1448314 RepID=A0A317US18_ASPEC|nr:uncharacterized protein BO83DRAFT_411398 [Aspergillus eucalypticola CBS 122712]PWY64425.1 hypothetical protein BO83DRAFT_411398 [Aspergillus eucalypticola CBS 122712]